MSKNIGLLRIFFILIIYPIVVRGYCEVEVKGNPPLFIRQFGSRKVVQRNAKVVSLNPGEHVTSYCSSNLIIEDFRPIITEEDNVHSATFHCTSRGLLIEKYMEEYRGILSFPVRCSSYFVKLFESNETLPNCDDYISYGIGIQALEGYETTALCYDLDTLSIKYLKYLTYRQNNNLLPTKRTFKDVPIISLDNELFNFHSLFSFVGKTEFQKTFEDERTRNLLLTNQEFEFDSLLQDTDLFKDLKNFEPMFNIAWWHNLRKGNWNFFSDALKARIQNVTYVAYTGVSNTLTIPSLQDHGDNKKLELKIKENTVKVPFYVYTYLHSIEMGIEEDVVVIAYNTPYFSLNTTELLCKDICDEIEWLKSSLFGRTHLMPVYGVMICCHPKDVADKLQNFPIEEDEVMTTTQLNV